MSQQLHSPKSFLIIHSSPSYRLTLQPLNHLAGKPPPSSSPLPPVSPPLGGPCSRLDLKWVSGVMCQNLLMSFSKFTMFILFIQNFWGIKYHPNAWGHLQSPHGLVMRSQLHHRLRPWTQQPLPSRAPLRVLPPGMVHFRRLQRKKRPTRNEQHQIHPINVKLKSTRSLWRVSHFERWRISHWLWRA